MLAILTRFPAPRLVSASLLAAIALLAPPAWAGDPFRPSNPHAIGDETEAAFEAIFKEGDYRGAETILVTAIQQEPNEPLAYAMKASFAYDGNDLEAMKTYAARTREAAERLSATDPLRSNLYIAVGHFLEGGYLLKKGSYLQAVGKTGTIFEYLDKATALSPNDPEVNLLRGYLDLFLSRYTPFNQSEQVIKRFEQFAAPDYLKYRALATTYRDLEKYDLAMANLDKALAITPDNPELLYLKGQFLRNEGRREMEMDKLQAAQTYYQKALLKQDQLSRALIVQLNHEYNAVRAEIEKLAQIPDLKTF
ncbi:MAG: Sll0314/Alr1548 family TPR repeat-containing protein [Synechocystis sp.]|nr:Sll0314/Alr1548 family TPR repeat-containing protein [Synechocystis sp.]